MFISLGSGGIIFFLSLGDFEDVAAYLAKELTERTLMGCLASAEKKLEWSWLTKTFFKLAASPFKMVWFLLPGFVIFVLSVLLFTKNLD